MSDTIPGVRWSLAMECPLRREDEEDQQAKRLFSLAQSYSYSLTRPSRFFRVHEGVCITSTSAANSSEFQHLPSYQMPREGFVLEQVFETVGGVVGLQSLCGNCPANAALDGVAGCKAWFEFPASHSELDEELHRLAAKLDLKLAIEAIFPVTDLMWYGFWIESPLSRPQMEVLLPLLQELLSEDSGRTFEVRDVQGLMDFTRAIERSLYYDLPLHVEMMPPGHVDFGWHTTFSHCPRCKVGAAVAQWGEVASDWIRCGMCGHEFNPAATYSMEKMERRERSDLRELMGDERYQLFAAAFIAQQGASTEDAAAMVEWYLSPERIEKIREIRESNRRRNKFITSILFEGIGRIEAGYEHMENPPHRYYRFTATEMEVLLARCRQHGVGFMSISHYCEGASFSSSRARPEDFVTAEAAFQSLLDEGCNGYFSVFLKAPDPAAPEDETKNLDRKAP